MSRLFTDHIYNFSLRSGKAAYYKVQVLFLLRLCLRKAERAVSTGGTIADPTIRQLRVWKSSILSQIRTLANISKTTRKKVGRNLTFAQQIEYHYSISYAVFHSDPSINFPIRNVHKNLKEWSPHENKFGKLQYTRAFSQVDLCSVPLHSSWGWQRSERKKLCHVSCEENIYIDSPIRTWKNTWWRWSQKR